MRRCPRVIFSNPVDKGLSTSATSPARFRPRDLHRGRRDAQKNNGKFGLLQGRLGSNLQTEHERYLTEQVTKKPILNDRTTPEGDQGPSTCAWTTTARPSARGRTAWCPAYPARSSAAASARKAGRAEARMAELGEARPEGLLSTSACAPLQPLPPRGYSLG